MAQAVGLLVSVVSDLDFSTPVADVATGVVLPSERRAQMLVISIYNSALSGVERVPGACSALFGLATWGFGSISC